MVGLFRSILNGNSVSDLALQDALLREYKKVSAVRVMSCGRSGRYAILYFNSMTDVEAAIQENKNNKYFMDWPIEVDVFLAGEELIDDK